MLKFFIFFQTTKFHFGKMFQQIIRNFNLFSHHSVHTSGSELPDFVVRLVVSCNQEPI